MREIKFRAWDKVLKEFLPNVQNHINDKEWAFGSMLKNSERWGIMQFTGLKDKNGKDIYEHDIVCVYDEVIRKVEFKNAFWQLEEFISENVLGGFGTEMESGHKPIYRYPNWGIEVIGNIYEKPE